jgi:hypothetical protein
MQTLIIIIPMHFAINKFFEVRNRFSNPGCNVDTMIIAAKEACW